jgi:tetratricopeptide (TPR) repeat protein
VSLLQELALSLAQQGRFAEAEAHFVSIVRDHPAGPIAQWAYPNLGRVLLQQQKWAEAESALRKGYGLYHKIVSMMDVRKSSEDWQMGFNMVNKYLAIAVQQQGKFVNHDLWSQTKLDPKTVSFIQAGTSCGSDVCAVCGENIWGDAVAYKWEGVVVEADPLVYGQLVKNYEFNPKVLSVNAAITTKNGAVTFFSSAEQPEFMCVQLLCT